MSSFSDFKTEKDWLPILRFFFSFIAFSGRKNRNYRQKELQKLIRKFYVKQATQAHAPLYFFLALATGLIRLWCVIFFGIKICSIEGVTNRRSGFIYLGKEFHNFHVSTFCSCNFFKYASALFLYAFAHAIGFLLS